MSGRYRSQDRDDGRKMPAPLSLNDSADVMRSVFARKLIGNRHVAPRRLHQDDEGGHQNHE